jgi:hypothetical protein
MPDVYAAIAEVDVATQERLAAILELRAADPSSERSSMPTLRRSSSPRARKCWRSAAERVR